MTYLDSILATYDAATLEQREAGSDWYPQAGRMISALADWSGVDDRTMAAVVAALSPRNPWNWNVADAAAFARAYTDGAPMPTATTFGANRERAWAFLSGAGSWTSSALKVRSFVANMTGDLSAVTVDVWAIRVATGGAENIVRTDRQYRELAEAYRAAAMVRGVKPAVMQAVTWIVAQDAGTGSNRRGRHDKSIKRGTAAFVAELLTGQLSLGV